MPRELRPAIRVATTAVTMLVLGAAFYQRASYNLSHIDYRNSNFVFFWMSGRMLLAGQNPYDSTLWLAQHDANSVTWRPNQIFPYPLPLAFFLAPLGLVSLPAAYLAWQLVSGALIALTVWSMLRRQRDARHQRLLIPLLLILLFFGPVLLTLQIGTLGAFTLAAVMVASNALEDDHPWLAGLVLSLTLLKPPQGLPILLLAGIWLLSRRNWKAIGGMALGAVGLLLIGMLEDPSWLRKFGAASQEVMHRTLGIQSNVIGLAYAACGGNTSCMWLAGGVAAIALLALVGRYLWRHQADLSPWETFNLIIPTAFVCTLYLWSYDQILYILPIVWIVLELVARTRSYLASFAFLILLTLLSLAALVFQARTRSDLVSLATTAVVLGCTFFLLYSGNRRAKASPATP